MSRSLNRVQLIGRLGKDAETKFTQNGKPRSLFSVATDRQWKDRETGELKKETDWHNVVAWNSENLAQYLTKGTQVYVEGRLQTRSWEDRDGTKKYITEIVSEQIILLGSKQGGGHNDGEMKSRPRSSQPADVPANYDNLGGGISDDDVPF